ncbi:MAG: sialate O-acetylesterase, partial [Myxococcota bacterium]|nr:sialate O-acetylesterase [Myxococcota bacterium]
AGAPGDCDDRDADVSPDAQEVCNGKDDDCDGQTDIGCPYGDIDLQVGPGPLQFYPRDLVSDTCAFTLEGTGRGAAEEVRIVVTRDGVLHSEASAASDAFAIDVTLDAGLHRYDLAVSWDAGSGHWTESQTIEDIVCGDVFLIDGQSNAVASDYHGERLGDLERNPFVRSFGSATTDASVIHDDAFGIAVANTPHVHASIGQWGIRMANRLSAEAEIPILVINGAVGGTSVWQHQRNGADPTDVNTIYGRMLWRAQRAGVADAVRAMVWHQGEADGGTAYGDYLEAWAAMHDGWQTDYPNLEGAYVLQPRAGCGGPTWNRNVHRDLPDLVDGVIGHMSTTGVDGHDGCHFYNSSYVEWGERMARLIQRDLYGASLDDDIEAPDPVSAVWTSPTALEIDFGDTGNGLVLQAGAEAYFRLSDGAVVDRARVEDSRVVLTTASPSSAAWVSFVDESGDIPWLVNARGIGSFAWYEL